MFVSSFKSFFMDIFLSKFRDLTFLKSILFTTISILICTNFITERIFVTCDDTRVLFLMIVSLCIWIGIFNSISDIPKIQKNLNDDFERGLSIAGFVVSEYLIQMLLCLIETIFVVSVILVNYNFPSETAVFSVKYIDYFVSVFLIFFVSDSIGILFSVIAIFISKDNPFSFTMTITPMLLLIQLLFSNTIFQLKGNLANFISHLSICKWGVYCLEKIVNINKYPRAITLSFPQIVYSEKFSIAEDTDVIIYWIIFLIFIVICFTMSILLLKLTTKLRRK